MTMKFKKFYSAAAILAMLIVIFSNCYANEYFFNVENPKEEVYSPLKISWEAGTLQIYDGTSPNPIHHFVESESPVIVDLENRHYVFKRWINGGSEMFDVNVLKPIDESGAQLKADSWVTVPGDACRPEILDLAELYQKYGKYVHIDNEDNPSQTILIADGESHSNDNKAVGDTSPYIMHNIAYLRKVVTKSLRGLHSASYSFKFPSLATGLTVGAF